MPNTSKDPPTNYTPHILQLARQGTDLRPANILAHYELILAGGQRVPCQPQTLERLYQMDFTALDYRCRNLSGDTATIRRWLCDVIQRQVDQLSPDAGMYFPAMGWNTLNGAHVYLAGNRLIGPDASSLRAPILSMPPWTPCISPSTKSCQTSICCTNSMI